MRNKGGNEMKRRDREAWNSMCYTIHTVWEADKGSVLFPFYKNITEYVFNGFFDIYLIKYIYECIDQHISYSLLARTVLIFCLIQIVVHINSASQAYYVNVKKPKIYRHVFNRVINKARTIELTRYEQPDFYDHFSRALDECLNHAEDGIVEMTLAFGQICASLVAAGIVAAVDWKLLLMTIPPIAGGFILGMKENVQFFELQKEETKERRRMDYLKRVFYEKKYAPEIRLYSIRNLLSKNYKKSYTGRYEINWKYRKKMVWYSIINAVILEGAITFMAYLYITYVVKACGSHRLGAYVAIISAISYITWSMRDMTRHWKQSGKYCVYMNNLKEFFQCESIERKRGSKKPDETIGEIEFKNVSYTYTGSKKPVIEDLNLHIHKGERIALVGENGAGKTTLMKLLMGLYPVSKGKITAGGGSVEEYDPDLYHDRIGTVFQDLQIFSVTLAENVLMREPKNEAERQCVKDALEKAQFGDKLKELPKGIDTMLTKEFDPEGFVCSGGQAQKVAIARVFAKNPDVVILDEPSSALDPIAEYNMYHNMMEAAEGKTVFFISHRMSSARIADRIFYMEHGKIMESGTHKELMELGGKYAEMFELQAKNYRDEVEVTAYE